MSGLRMPAHNVPVSFAEMFAARFAEVERRMADAALCPNGSTCSVVGCTMSHPDIEYEDADLVYCTGCGEVASYGSFMREHVASGRDCGVYC